MHQLRLLSLTLSLVAWVCYGSAAAQVPGANVYFGPQWPAESLGWVLRGSQDVLPGQGAILWPERLPVAVQLDVLRAVAALRQLPPDEAVGFLQIPFVYLPKLLPELEARAILHVQQEQLRRMWQQAAPP